MKRSITIKPGHRMLRRRRRRGTAEIELLFSAVVLITLMLLTWAAFRVGRARQQVVRDANFGVDYQANGWSLFKFPDLAFWNNEKVDPPEARVDGAPDSVPTIADLPNRMYAKKRFQYIRSFAGAGLIEPHTWITARSTVAGPSWTWFGWPSNEHQNNDRDAVQKWYGDVAEMATGDVKDALRLADE